MLLWRCSNACISVCWHVHPGRFCSSQPISGALCMQSHPPPAGVPGRFDVTPTWFGGLFTNTISLEEQVTQAPRSLRIWILPGVAIVRWNTTRVLLIDETIDEAELRSVFVNPYTRPSLVMSHLFSLGDCRCAVDFTPA